MKKIFLSLSLIAGLAAGFGGCSSDSIDLKFNPPAGSKYRMVMTTDQNIKQEMMGQKIDVKSLSENSMLYEISKADGDNKEIKMTFERMKTSQKAMGKEMLMDSDQTDTANPGSKIMGSIKGSVFEMQVNSKGEVKNIKGMDALMDKMLFSAGENLPPEQKARMSEGVKSIMNEDMLKGMIEQSFKIFPAQKVKASDTWTSKVDMKSIMDMTIETTYTLKKVEKGIVYLDLKSKITPNGKEKMIQGTKVETSLSGNQTGTMELEAATGMTLNSNISQKLEGKMKANGMEIPMSIEGNITMKTTKL